MSGPDTNAGQNALESERVPEAKKMTFFAIGQACFDAALQDNLKELRFHESPSAEIFLFAWRKANKEVVEYARRRLTDEGFQRFEKMAKELDIVVSVCAGTPMERVLYWGEKLGICDPDGDIERTLDRVRRYYVAEHRRYRHEFDELNVDQIADLLEADVKAKTSVTTHDVNVPIDELVTLSQMEPLVGKGKRTLERYLRKGKLPSADIPGGRGRASKWYWSTVREPLQKIAKRVLPERFPGSRII